MPNSTATHLREDYNGTRADSNGLKILFWQAVRTIQSTYSALFSNSKGSDRSHGSIRSRNGKTGGHLPCGGTIGKAEIRCVFLQEVSRTQDGADGGCPEVRDFDIIALEEKVFFPIAEGWFLDGVICFGRGWWPHYFLNSKLRVHYFKNYNKPLVQYLLAGCGWQPLPGSGINIIFYIMNPRFSILFPE